MSHTAVIDASTRLIGLLGHPVSHVASPKMHNLAYQLDGLNYVYLAFDVLPENLPGALDAMRALNIRGVNVAKPHRENILSYLDELSPAARLVGTVNTVVNEQGKLIGHMTDGMGFVHALSEQGIDIRGKKLTLLGSGGAGTAIQIQAALDGAREIAIFNLEHDEMFNRARETIAKLKIAAPDCVVTLFPLRDRERLKDQIAASDILIDATPVGSGALEGQSNIDDLSLFHPELVVFHTLYNPRESQLLLDAASQGCRTFNGSGMLIGQGAIAYELWLGQPMPVAEIRRALFQ